MSTIRETVHLTTKQLCERLNIKEQTARFWRTAGRGPAYIRLYGKRGHVLYPLSEVEKWERSRLVHNTAEEHVARHMEESSSTTSSND